MEILTSRLLVSPTNFEFACSRCEAFGLRSLRVYGPLEAPAGIVFATGGGGALEITRSSPTPPSGLRIWLQVPSLAAALEDLVVRKYPGHVGTTTQQPWGLFECPVELFDGVSIVLVEVPREHPLHWRG